MKINSINNNYAVNVAQQYQTTLKKSQNTDIISSESVNTITTYSKIDTTTKNYGDLFAKYLDSVGFCANMNEEQKTEFLNDVKNNIYTFDSNKVSNVYESYFKISDSVSYLRSLCNRIENYELRNEFKQLINSYQTNNIQAIKDYTAELANAEMNEEQQMQLQKLQEMMNETSVLLQQLESSKEQTDAMEESFKVISNCMKIAMRLLKGDKVPAEDIQYLMENNTELFKIAMSMRQHNDDPEEHESVVDEDKESSNDIIKPVEACDELSEVVASLNATANSKI